MQGQDQSAYTLISDDLGTRNTSTGSGSVVAERIPPKFAGARCLSTDAMRRSPRPACRRSPAWALDAELRFRALPALARALRCEYAQPPRSPSARARAVSECLPCLSVTLVSVGLRAPVSQFLYMSLPRLFVCLFVCLFACLLACLLVGVLGSCETGSYYAWTQSKSMSLTLYALAAVAALAVGHPSYGHQTAIPSLSLCLVSESLSVSMDGVPPQLPPIRRGPRYCNGRHHREGTCAIATAPLTD